MRIKRGEPAQYELRYHEDFGLFQIVEMGQTPGSHEMDYLQVGGCENVQELVLFVREMNLMTIGYRTHLSLNRVIGEFEHETPFNLKIFLNQKVKQ